MDNIIQLLPDTLSNQIAAGEVVQRPCSVVKELLENSIDAQAQNITLIYVNAGKTLIQVIDDGLGMNEADARMCFEKHATSKIKCIDDLLKVRTMGFRGEALASIAAVAQVNLKTNNGADALGINIDIEGSKVLSQTAISFSKGTSFAVKNLFYNIPARRNFLKSDSIESRHITDEFIRVALANPEIGFKLYNDKKEIYHLPPSKLSSRIVNIFGKNYQKQLISCHENTDIINIKGYLGKPEFAKRTRGEQFFFVNNRFIKSSYLAHAIKSEYEGLIRSEYFPFYVLFIEIDPRSIDVNVHPTKTEIKFEDERTVYYILKSAIKKSIATHHLVPSIDFTKDINSSTSVFLEKATIDVNRQKNTSMDRQYASFKTYDDRNKRKMDWSAFVTPDNHNKQNMEEAPIITLDSKLNIGNKEEKLEQQKSTKYIYIPIKSGLLIIDKKLAHEKILYERFIKKRDIGSESSQQLLFPIRIQLNQADYAMLLDARNEIRSLGFEAKFGKNSQVEVIGCPGDLKNYDLKGLIESIIDQLKLDIKVSIPISETIAKSLAKKISHSNADLNEDKEIDSLVDQLFACESPQYSPSGKRVFVKIQNNEIENLFLE